MGPPVGIQLGVELTNLVAPLTTAALRVGSRAIREAIERSGSDEVIERKLADILGRHRLDPIISTHFRTIVAHSSQTELSRFMKELVLESGAGPTVTQALAGDNGSVALLSMVIQLSFLAWSHEHQSLGQAVAQMADEVLQECNVSGNHGLNYALLLGTISAVQQQTATFSWEHHYKMAEEKLKSPTPLNKAGTRPRKRQKSSASRQGAHAHQQSISDRAIPYVVLRGLILSLESIQRFPEAHLLEISSDRGITSIVVWCYYILGQSIIVHLDSMAISFGDGPYLITLKSCGQFQTFVTLLKRETKNVPIFSLSRGDLDPYIETDRRAHARGFLSHILKLHGFKEDELAGYGDWILSTCLKHFEQHSLPSTRDSRMRCKLAACNNSEKDLEIPSADEQDSEVTTRGNGMQEEIASTISFLLDINNKAFTNLADGSLTGVRRPGGNSNFSGVLAVWLVYAFARVRNRDEIGDFPLSVDLFERLGSDKSVITHSRGHFGGLVPNTVECFDLICQLLLGGRYTKESTSKAFLISDRGWSVFFSTLDAVDPTDADSGNILIKLGVPARYGLRKARIVDGMTGLGVTASRTLDPGSDISYWPDVWTSKLVGTYVGYEGLDAFSVVQTYDWAHMTRNCKKWRLGFREKQDICMKFNVLERCRCCDESSELDRRHMIDEMIWPPLPTEGFVSTSREYTVEYPKDMADSSRTPERVFHCGDIWFFFVSGDSAARWLGLDGIWQLEFKQAGFIRGPGCCVKCAINAVTIPALVLL